MRKEGRGLWLELNQIEHGFEKASSSHPHPTIPAFLSAMLGKFHSVFDLIFNTQEGLPRIREHEHAIVLKEGSNPVGVRHCRYP